MPPAGKGKGKKTRGGGTLGSNTNLHQRRSRSRNTSPSSATAVSDTTFSSDKMTSYQDIVDHYLTGDSTIPSAVTLHQLTSDLRVMQESVKRRLALYEESVKNLDLKILQKQDDVKKMRKADDDAKERRQRAAEEARKGKSPRKDGDKIKKKKDRQERETDGKRPPAHGAHQLPSQHAEVVIPVDSKRRKRKIDPDDRSASRSPPVKRPRSESSDHQLEPMPAEIIYEPLEDDPTIYEIEQVTPDMSIEDRKRIYRVASFPTIDLSPLQPGIPPDEDFSKGKAPNQVSLNAFHNMIEPYFRLFNEEDEAFLRERGDRVQPFIMPALGKHYKKVWAEEDGTSFAAFERPSPSPNEPRGSPERLNDNALESEDISVGPLMARVLAAMIPEEEPATVEEAKPKDRDTPMTNGIMTNGDTVPNGEPTATLTVSSSTNLVPVASEATVKAQPVQKTDYAALEQRLLQEMKYIGLIPLNAPEPDWSERQDDEVSARLRLLQKQLHKTAVGVGAMKARLAEMLEPQIAYQEYSTIHDDLDRQLETAYSKRTRTIKAKKKKVGHHLANGNAAGVAQSRIGIGDVAKSIMEKRLKWHNEVGPVFDTDMRKLPKESMFQDIDEYVKLEEEMFRAAMEEAQEAEADG